MEIHLIQYGQIAWRASLFPNGARSEATTRRKAPLWSQDSYPSASAALADAESVAGYLDELEPAA